MRFHISLPVKNIRETVAFYRVLFEVEPATTKPDYAKFLPSTVHLNISFHESPAGAGELQALHLGLEVPDREHLDRVYTRLAKAGVIAAERETVACCYARQDKFRLADPDGYRWEIYQRLGDTEATPTPATGCCAPGPTPSAGLLAREPPWQGDHHVRRRRRHRADRDATR